MRLALFDLDNTLLSGDTDVEWLQFLIDEGVLDAAREQAANDDLVRRYRQGAVGMHEFVRFYLRLFVPHSLATLLAWRERFVRARIVPRIPASARALLAAHRDAGDLMLIITATNRFLTEPIAANLEVTNLIATDPEMRADRFTGEVTGVPCFREGKVARLHQWLAGQERELEAFDESWFYSDSINDAPLMQRVTHPVAVDPDPQLEQLAHERGWRLLRLER